VTPVSLTFRGACRDEDPELFFPVGNTGPALLQIEDAKEVCRRCEVVDACLLWALETGQDAGVWGGMSEDERRSIRRRAARPRGRREPGAALESELAAHAIRELLGHTQDGADKQAS
jgi:WhiB family transcriptional regulator, redox-sensing transcriptional regulator